MENSITNSNFQKKIKKKKHSHPYFKGIPKKVAILLLMLISKKRQALYQRDPKKVAAPLLMLILKMQLALF